MGGIKTKSTGSLVFFSPQATLGLLRSLSSRDFYHLFYFPGAHFCSTFSDLQSQSDFVVPCTPLTSETSHMLSATEHALMKPTATLVNIARGGIVNHDDLTAKEHALMKPTATLVNIARGGIVNHDDLTDALKNGVIRAAALDVTEPEPLPRDHPLLKMANVTLTPHFGSAAALKHENENDGGGRDQFTSWLK